MRRFPPSRYLLSLVILTAAWTACEKPPPPEDTSNKAVGCGAGGPMLMDTGGSYSTDQAFCPPERPDAVCCTSSTFPNNASGWCVSVEACEASSAYGQPCAETEYECTIQLEGGSSVRLCMATQRACDEALGRPSPFTDPGPEVGGSSGDGGATGTGGMTAGTTTSAGGMGGATSAGGMGGATSAGGMGGATSAGGMGGAGGGGGTGGSGPTCDVAGTSCTSGNACCTGFCDGGSCSAACHTTTLDNTAEETGERRIQGVFTPRGFDTGTPAGSYAQVFERALGPGLTTAAGPTFRSTLQTGANGVLYEARDEMGASHLYTWRLLEVAGTMRLYTLCDSFGPGGFPTNVPANFSAPAGALTLWIDGGNSEGTIRSFVDPSVQCHALAIPPVAPRVVGTSTSDPQPTPTQGGLVAATYVATANTTYDGGLAVSAPYFDAVRVTPTSTTTATLETMTVIDDFAGTIVAETETFDTAAQTITTSCGPGTVFAADYTRNGTTLIIHDLLRSRDLTYTQVQ